MELGNLVQREIWGYVTQKCYPIRGIAQMELCYPKNCPKRQQLEPFEQR